MTISPLIRGVLLLTLMSGLAAADLLAFPGATGFGKHTQGGRGGTVLFVTNLNDSGAGSFREAVRTSGPRIVVFRVGGTITLESAITVTNPYLTIAGQTAPGDGVLIRGAAIKFKTSEVIVRNIRFRLGRLSSGTDDAITIVSDGGLTENIILDRCSISWASDENIGVNGKDGGLRNLTVQNSIIGECLKGHSMGLLFNRKIGGVGPEKVSVHQNLFVSNQERCPKFGGGISGTVINNLVHNWKAKAAAFDSATTGDVIGNAFKGGADTTGFHRGIELTDIAETDGVHTGIFPMIFLQHNLPNGGDYNGDGSDLADHPYYTPAIYGFTPLTNKTDIESWVLGHAGALPLDAVDLRLIAEYQAGTGRTINHENETPGYPLLAGGTAPADRDNDGMPDTWEITNGLNPDAKDDADDRNGDGYTNIEDYLNSLMPSVEANASPTVVLTSPANGAAFTTGTAITINATASDSDGTITKVEFFRDAVLIGSDTTAPYSVVWNGATAGTYTLTAKAYNNDAAVTTSASRSVTVSAAANQAPAVALTSPANGAAFTTGATITISATANDSDGTIAKVEFFRDAVLIGSDTTAPYSVAWNGAAVGSYALTAKAYDDDAAVTASAARSITVTAIVEPEPDPADISRNNDAEGCGFGSGGSLALVALALLPLRRRRRVAE